MYTFTNNLNKEEYDNFINNYQMASFMQEYNWSNVKTEWDSIHCGLYKNNKLIAVCSILIKTVFKKFKIFYIPRGYLIDYNNLNDLKEMTLHIKKLAKDKKAFLIKIDPNFCIKQFSLKNLDIKENYAKDYKTKNDNLIKLGYINTGLKKEIGKNLQPQYNIVAPICDNNNNILTEEEILKTYKSKFKYYLKDFHKKRGITFEITNDISRVHDFVKMLKQTEKKQNINLRDEKYFINIMKNFKEKAFLVFGSINLNKYIEFLKNNNEPKEKIEEANNLLKKFGENLILSSALIILPPNKTGIRTSEYLYAGNSLNLTKLNVSAGTVFELIKFSSKNNCHYCNLGGVNGNLNDHLTIFKEKFNGQVLVFCGEYDLPINNFLYFNYKILSPIYLKIFKKIVSIKYHK